MVTSQEIKTFQSATPGEIAQAESLIARGKAFAARGDPRLQRIISVIGSLTQVERDKALADAQRREDVRQKILTTQEERFGGETIEKLAPTPTVIVLRRPGVQVEPTPVKQDILPSITPSQPSIITSVSGSLRERTLERLSPEAREEFFRREEAFTPDRGTTRAAQELELGVVGGVIGFGQLIKEPSRIREVPKGIVQRGREIGSLFATGDIGGGVGAVASEVILFKGVTQAGRGVGRVVRKGAEAPALFPTETGLSKIKLPKQFEPVGKRVTTQIGTLSGFKDISLQAPVEPIGRLTSRTITRLGETRQLPSIEPVGRQVSARISEFEFRSPPLEAQIFPQGFRRPTTKTPLSTTFPKQLDLEFQTSVRQAQQLRAFEAQRKPEPLTFGVERPSTIVFDIAEDTRPLPKRVEPLTVSLDPAFVRKLKQPQVFDVIEKPKRPKRQPTFFEFEFEAPKGFEQPTPPKPPKAKKPKKPKKEKKLLTIEDFRDDFAPTGRPTGGGQQQLLLAPQKQIQKQVQIVKIKDIVKQQPISKQIQGQRFDFISPLRQSAISKFRVRSRFDLGAGSLLKLTTSEIQGFSPRQAERQIFKFDQPQPQRIKLAQPPRLALAQPQAPLQSQRQKIAFAPKIDLTQISIAAPGVPLETPRDKRKKPTPKKKKKKRRVLIRPSFTGIVLGIQEAPSISPTLGIVPGQIRGLRTGFT